MSVSFGTPWTLAYQAPLSMGVPRQEYQSGLPCPSLGDLSNPGVTPTAPALQTDPSPSGPPGLLQNHASKTSSSAKTKTVGGTVPDWRSLGSRDRWLPWEILGGESNAWGRGGEERVKSSGNSSAPRLSSVSIAGLPVMWDVNVRRT